MATAPTVIAAANAAAVAGVGATKSGAPTARQDAVVQPMPPLRQLNARVRSRTEKSSAAMSRGQGVTAPPTMGESPASGAAGGAAVVVVAARPVRLRPVAKLAKKLAMN